MAQLPDPTCDLDWSGYVGSIQERFRDAAQRHPDRVCVVETKSSKSPERVFTYRQIYEASNTLAHYLHDAGIGNGDVVMIFAHRSVDLVVAVMGTLAAAATMSVLDPLYPPARQQIYLEVAKPRALVQLARATDEAAMAPPVRRFIDEELELKTEVPALRLGDDGFLYGSETGKPDVFAAVRSKSSAQPDALVGPDSNPTLSFTSGSEGKPKGVLGRHYSLAKYFDFMAERFELSESDKFTLLSGIAHDPVQRDIFTPLYLGAQLLVPSKEDIQHEKLAEWMREHKPTVTHLTPAMGQVMVGGAVATFDSLRRAFFVGDVLTTRDCRSLRNLAVNVNIINMYGTTETQRAVSYYEVPNRAIAPDFLEELGKDTVPSGRGMQNVQLLVVNREDSKKLCQVGEEGEIYVRAAGLAEGYLGDKALNEQKFLGNWFVDNDKWVKEDKEKDRGEPWRKYYKGPRDRLYRTGDLGRYLESGDVECTGRADDQVKIRGFRIELNEIDSNLNQSPLIRDCKTLLRRDRNEEHTLVSYIVPELKEWTRWLAAQHKQEIGEEDSFHGSVKVYKKRFQPLQTELRDHLKLRLPSYAVPTRYIFLDKFPLNPNGKVDKPNLPPMEIEDPQDEVTEEDLERWKSMSATQREVATQWAEVFDGLKPQAIHPEDNFFALGGHSLLAQRVLFRLRKALNAEVSFEALVKYPTLESFSAQMEKMANTNGNAATQSVSSVDLTANLEERLLDLSSSYPTRQSVDEPRTFFVTGATGFLGVYIIKNLLDRNPSFKVIAHVRGAETSGAAFERLKKSLIGSHLWQDEWTARLTCVVGDLSQPYLGLDKETWDKLVGEVDSVIHNGGEVHWLYSYKRMEATNVLSTLWALRMCAEGKAKLFTYVSSTSVLDSEHYMKMSTEGKKVSEDDDLEGSRKGLGAGYGQTKWVSEQLARQAGRRGLRGTVIRPGYILGDTETGLCNKDDFLIRILKDCIDMQLRPKITNTVNAVPVTHVASVVGAASLRPLEDGVHVANVDAHPRLQLNEYLSSPELYGYKVAEVDFNEWIRALSRYIDNAHESGKELPALTPLISFCNDLPSQSRAPEMDDSNAMEILKACSGPSTKKTESDGYGISREDVGRFMWYLSKKKFLSLPPGGSPLPAGNLSDAQIRANGEAVGGRGGSSK